MDKKETKIVTIGNQYENNKRVRYALIVMKLDRIGGQSIDNTITFYNSNNLKKLQQTQQILQDISLHKTYYIDTQIFDYENMKYIKAR